MFFLLLLPFSCLERKSQGKTEPRMLFFRLELGEERYVFRLLSCLPRKEGKRERSDTKERTREMGSFLGSYGFVEWAGLASNALFFLFSSFFLRAG